MPDTRVPPVDSSGQPWDAEEAIQELAEIADQLSSSCNSESTVVDEKRIEVADARDFIVQYLSCGCKLRYVALEGKRRAYLEISRAGRAFTVCGALLVVPDEEPTFHVVGDTALCLSEDRVADRLYEHWQSAQLPGVTVPDDGCCNAT